MTTVTPPPDPTDGPPVALDRQRLESLVEDLGDRALVRDAVTTYLLELPDRLARIRTAVALGVRDDVRSSAHELGSPSAMLGAVAVASTTRALQNPDAEARTDLLVAELETAAAATAREMRDYLDPVAD